MSNDVRVFILSPLNNSKMMVAVFIVNCFKLKSSLCPHPPIDRKTVLTSHISVCLGYRDLRCEMLLINFSIDGCCDIFLNSGI